MPRMCPRLGDVSFCWLWRLWGFGPSQELMRVCCQLNPEQWPPCQHCHQAPPSAAQCQTVHGHIMLRCCYATRLYFPSSSQYMHNNPCMQCKREDVQRWRMALQTQNRKATDMHIFIPKIFMSCLCKYFLFSAIPIEATI